MPRHKTEDSRAKFSTPWSTWTGIPIKSGYFVACGLKTVRGQLGRKAGTR